MVVPVPSGSGDPRSHPGVSMLGDKPWHFGGGGGIRISAVLPIHTGSFGKFPATWDHLNIRVRGLCAARTRFSHRNLMSVSTGQCISRLAVYGLELSEVHRGDVCWARATASWRKTSTLSTCMIMSQFVESASVATTVEIQSVEVVRVIKVGKVRTAT